jgi:hypothetical protein
MHKSIETLLPMDSPEQKVDDQVIGEVRPLGTASGPRYNRRNCFSDDGGFLEPSLLNEAVNERAEPFEPDPSAEVALELFVDLRLPRSGRRSITFSETLPTSPIAPLDETGSQVIALAIAADQFLQLRLACRLLRERPRGLNFIPESLFRGRC